MARSPRSRTSRIMLRILVEIGIGLVVLSAIVAAVDHGSPYAAISVVAPRPNWFLPSGPAAPEPPVDLSLLAGRPGSARAA